MFPQIIVQKKITDHEIMQKYEETIKALYDDLEVGVAMETGITWRNKEMQEDSVKCFYIRVCQVNIESDMTWHWGIYVQIYGL